MSPHPRHVAPRGTLASEPSVTSSGWRRVLEVAEQPIFPRVECRRSAPIEHLTLSSTSSSLHHVTSHLVFTNSALASERRASELEEADHSTSLRVEQRRSAPIEPELAHNPVSKPRSRRCFVCGTTGRHPLDFRVCPRTAVLLRRSLAKINDDGRLVSFDGSPLPMTRHPGGVAAHLISRFRNPMRIVLEPPKSPPAPRVAHTPPHPVSTEPPDRLLSPPREFNSSSPHVIPPVDPIAPAPEHVPHRRVSPYDLALSRTRTTFILLLLEFMLNPLFRAQLRAILMLIERLNAEDPSTLRGRIQPVFMRISHFIPAT